MLDELFRLRVPLPPAACSDGSVMDPRRWFWRNSRGASGVTGEWREFAVEGEAVLFWATPSGPLDADSGLAPPKGPWPLSIVSWSLSRTVCAEELGPVGNNMETR